MTVVEFWPLPRTMTKKWGSGNRLWERMTDLIGEPDVAFGIQDTIPDGILGVDHNTGYEWADLPFKDDEFGLGFWDPPYIFKVDNKGMLHCKMFKKELTEIWRTCKRLAILHTYSYPTSWMNRSIRTHHIGLSYGPLKAHRGLQVFRKTAQQADIF